MRLILLHLLLCLPLGVQALQNQLADHASPYLAMHGKDPVAWQDWSDQVLATARRENKPIFISSGYFACHWCHVMQRESYQDKKIAALLNEFFIPVKLDRELHAALDAHLIDFVSRTQGNAGWPLNVFLTPEGYPILGLTYARPDRFRQLLQSLAELWPKDRKRVVDLARRATLQLRDDDASNTATATMSPDELRRRLVTEAMSVADDMSGGFGNQSRFPMAPQLLALLQVYADHRTEKLGAFLKLTLDRMASQGLRDHLAGGFFRYTVDPDWQVPHYEKMLYTQALLARVFLRAADVFDDTTYNDVAKDTLDFVLTHMRAPGGGFMASLSALDPAGAEGGSYLWTERQLVQSLSADELALARRYWGLQGVPATDSGYLPHRTAGIAELATEFSRSVQRTEALLRSAQSKLLSARNQRKPPADRKVLAGWNGLMITALAQASVSLDDPSYGRAAKAVADRLVADFWDGKRLLRARNAAGPLGAASIEDYAYLAEGLHHLGTTEPDGPLLQVRNQLLAGAWANFYQPGIGWRQIGQPSLPGMAVSPALQDGPLPSPTATIIALTQRVDQAEFRERVAEANAVALSTVQAKPFWHATYAQARSSSVQR